MVLNPPKYKLAQIYNVLTSVFFIVLKWGD